jgi:hypothetical protein
MAANKPSALKKIETFVLVKPEIAEDGLTIEIVIEKPRWIDSESAVITLTHTCEVNLDDDSNRLLFMLLSQMYTALKVACKPVIPIFALVQQEPDKTITVKKILTQDEVIDRGIEEIVKENFDNSEND